MKGTNKVRTRDDMFSLSVYFYLFMFYDKFRSKTNDIQLRVDKAQKPCQPICY